MKTTMKSVALFVVVLGVSALGLVGTASAANGSGGKKGSGPIRQSGPMSHYDRGDRSHGPYKFDYRRYDWDRYGRYGYGFYPCYSGYSYPWFEPGYCSPAIVLVPQYCPPQPVVEECQPTAPAPVVEEAVPAPVCAEPVCPEPCYSDCPPPYPYYAGYGGYYRGWYDKYWKDHGKKDKDPKPGKGGPPPLHPLTEGQHASASGNFGKATTKVAGNYRGGRR